MRVPPMLCPWRGYMADAVSQVGQGAAKPKPGDFSMCISCGGLMVFKLDLSMRKADEIDLCGLPAEQLDLFLKMKALQAALPPRPKRGGSA